MASLIALDWGTSTLRAWLVARDGHVLARRHAAAGIVTIRAGAFAQTFDDIVGPWRTAHGMLPALACGMIGSRQGWTEAPYVPCPCAQTDLPGHLAAARGGRLPLSIVPGVALDRAGRAPDVMRGEETQVFGALSAETGDGVFVLPGTHSKWVVVENGRIVRFATYMTGELFGVLRQHSILGRTMAPGEAAHDAAATKLGLEAGLAGGGELLHRLFAVRTLALFDRLTPDAGASYLSALLIGAEVAAAIAPERPPAVTLIGEESLVVRYGEALAAAGVRASTAEPDATPRGLWRIAEAAGLMH